MSHSQLPNKANQSVGAAFPKRCSIMAKKELKWTPYAWPCLTRTGSPFLQLSGPVHDALQRRLCRPRKPEERAEHLWQSGSDNAAQASQPLHLRRGHTARLQNADATALQGAAAVEPLLPVSVAMQKGAFHLAVEGQVPIIPMVCENYDKLYSSKDKRFRAGEIAIKGASASLYPPRFDPEQSCHPSRQKASHPRQRTLPRSR
jgi:lysophosphatidate acyltransferase